MLIMIPEAHDYQPPFKVVHGLEYAGGGASAAEEADMERHEAIEHLRRGWRSKRLTLYLGAGWGELRGNAIQYMPWEKGSRYRAEIRGVLAAVQASMMPNGHESLSSLASIPFGTTSTMRFLMSLMPFAIKSNHGN